METPVENVEQSGAKVSAGIPTYRGEFIYSNDAAVLKGNDFIYGVAIDDMSKQLAAQVEPIKNDEFDMVGVVVKGLLSKKEAGTEGWEDILTIVEIVKVNDKPAEVDIKIE